MKAILRASRYVMVIPVAGCLLMVAAVAYQLREMPAQREDGAESSR